MASHRSQRYLSSYLHNKKFAQILFISSLTSVLTIGLYNWSEYVLVGYGLLVFTFLTALLVGLQTQSSTTHITIIILLSMGIKLLTIDPVELGLYGGDPAITYDRVLLFHSTHELTRLFQEITWPLLYLNTDLLTRLLDIDTIIVAKYYPLITVLVPIFFYSFGKMVASRNVSFFAAIGIVALRNTTTFYSKFVDEGIAIVHLFLILYLIIFFSTQKKKNKTRAIILVIIAASALALSHPVAALFCCSMIFVIGFASKVPYLPFIEHEKTKNNILGVLVGAGIIISTIAIFIFIIPNISVGLIISLVTNSVSGDPTVASITKTPTKFETLRNIMSIYGHIAIIGLLSLIVSLGTLSSRVSTTRWDLAFTLIGGSITSLYAIQIVGGRLIGYDPFRYLIYSIPFLLIYSMRVIEVQDILDISPSYTRVVQIVVLMLFVTTQIAVIPPNLLYSDPSFKPIEEKGHFTPSDYSMVSFSNSYMSNDRIVVTHQPALWTYAGGGSTQPLSLQNCDEMYIVERENQPALIDYTEEWLMSRIYSSGERHIRVCGNI